MLDENIIQESLQEISIQVNLFEESLGYTLDLPVEILTSQDILSIKCPNYTDSEEFNVRRDNVIQSIQVYEELQNSVDLSEDLDGQENDTREIRNIVQSLNAQGYITKLEYGDEEVLIDVKTPEGDLLLAARLADAPTKKVGRIQYKFRDTEDQFPWVPASFQELVNDLTSYLK